MAPEEVGGIQMQRSSSKSNLASAAATAVAAVIDSNEQLTPSAKLKPSPSNSKLMKRSSSSKDLTSKGEGGDLGEGAVSASRRPSSAATRSNVDIADQHKLLKRNSSSNIKDPAGESGSRRLSKSNKPSAKIDSEVKKRPSSAVRNKEPEAKRRSSKI